MSLPDTAEYWQDVKSSFGRTKHKFTHAPNFDCGHFHVHEAKFINHVDCYECKKAIEDGRVDASTMKTENEHKLKIENQRKQKANKVKKKWLKKYPNNPICDKCGFVMLERTNKVNYNKFWGCSQFPTCNHTIKK